MVGLLNVRNIIDLSESRAPNVVQNVVVISPSFFLMLSVKNVSHNVIHEQ